MGRPLGSGRFTETKQIQIEPSMVERIETIVDRDPIRHPTFSHTIREAVEIGVPVIERRLEAIEAESESETEEVASLTEASIRGP